MKVSLFRIFVGSYFLLILQINPLQAQFSFRPKPLPTCKTFPIAELGVNFRLTSSPKFYATHIAPDRTYSRIMERERAMYYTSDIGIMRNISQQYALGISHFIGFDSEFLFRGGLKLRLRKWLRNEVSIDLSPGIILWDTGSAALGAGNAYHTPGFTGSVDLKVKEWFALSVMTEYMRARQGEDHHIIGGESHKYIREDGNDLGVYFGIKSGSYPGLVGNAAAGLTAVVMIALWYLSDEG